MNTYERNVRNVRNRYEEATDFEPASPDGYTFRVPREVDIPWFDGDDLVFTLPDFLPFSSQYGWVTATGSVATDLHGSRDQAQTSLASQANQDPRRH